MPDQSSHERQAFGLTILKNSHKEIRRLRRETGYPSIHGNKFWKSTYLLMDYLQEYPPANGARILEIGCGWGLAGIFCAKKFGARVTALDADKTVFPYLQMHAQLNGVQVETWQRRYEQVTKSDLAQFDMVIAADVCFWDSMVKPLYNLTRRAAQVGSLRVVMTDPGRPTFRGMAELCMEKLGAEYDNWSVPHPHNASGLVVDLAAEQSIA
jgi:predicted nicotinamide N-methyase